MAARHNWTLSEYGTRLGPSARHGTGTFAERDLPTGTLILVEAGLSATKGHGALLMHALLCPHLLLGLSPACAPIDETLSDRSLTTAYAIASNLKLHANDFDILNGQLADGGRVFFALSAYRAATTPAQRAQLRAAAEDGDLATKYKFLAYRASMFNGASTLDELNVTYGFASGLPATIFFVTRRPVACGEELLVDYGDGSNAAFAGVNQPAWEKVADTCAAYLVYRRRTHVVPDRILREISDIASRASELPRSSDEVELFFDFSDADVRVISDAYKSVGRT
jgi:hypothetical protein